MFELNAESLIKHWTKAQARKNIWVLGGASVKWSNSIVKNRRKRLVKA